MPYYIINEDNIVMGYSDTDGPDKTFIDQKAPSCDSDREDLKVVNGEIVTIINNEKKKYFEDNIYKRNRIQEYPPILDYIDGVVKDDQTQIDKYIEDCKAIKAKYPKPE